MAPAAVLAAFLTARPGGVPAGGGDGGYRGRGCRVLATDWQAHSVRGFISTAGKKLGLKIKSAKREDGERTHAK